MSIFNFTGYMNVIPVSHTGLSITKMYNVRGGKEDGAGYIPNKFIYEKYYCNNISSSYFNLSIYIIISVPV